MATKAKTETSEAGLSNQAYSAAERRLREMFPEQFQEFLKEEREARGLPYKPRLTEEQKARQMVLDAIEKYGWDVVPEAIQFPGLSVDSIEEIEAS